MIMVAPSLQVLPLLLFLAAMLPAEELSMVPPTPVALFVASLLVALLPPVAERAL